jgi:hypothetical protein
VFCPVMVVPRINPTTTTSDLSDDIRERRGEELCSRGRITNQTNARIATSTYVSFELARPTLVPQRCGISLNLADAHRMDVTHTLAIWQMMPTIGRKPKCFEARDGWKERPDELFCAPTHHRSIANRKA